MDGLMWRIGAIAILAGCTPAPEPDADADAIELTPDALYGTWRRGPGEGGGYDTIIFWTFAPDDPADRPELDGLHDVFDGRVLALDGSFIYHIAGTFSCESDVIVPFTQWPEPNDSLDQAWTIGPIEMHDDWFERSGVNHRRLVYTREAPWDGDTVHPGFDEEQ